MSRKRAPADDTAVGSIWFGCRLNGAGRSVLAVQSASASVRNVWARVLGKYARDEQALTLEEAVRRLATLPAENLKLEKRRRLRPGYYADVVVLDPSTIQDHATFQDPHRYGNGDGAGVREWRACAGGWRAHRGNAGESCSGRQGWRGRASTQHTWAISEGATMRITFEVPEDLLHGL